MKKAIIMAVVIAIVVGVGGFYVGATYAKSKSASSNRTGQGFPVAGGFQPGAGGNFVTRGGSGQRNGGSGGFVNGDIISKDASSVTLKLRDGGSKIVFFTDSTEVGKFVTGSVTDLTVGETVMVTGSANADGSVSAKSIQIRPAMPAPLGQPGQDSLPVQPKQ